jgi:hypothetical protein
MSEKGNLVNQFIDQQYTFKGQWDVPSICGLKLVDKQGQTIVIATELYHINPGTSVTFYCAELATQIMNEFKLDPHKMVFVQQIPDKGSHLTIYGEAFDRVSFSWDGKKFVDPKWQRISKEEVIALIS